MMENISNILQKRGYSEKQSARVAAELQDINDSLKSHLNKWLVSEEESDYHAEGFSLLELKRKFEMTYPAALLTMDWLIKEPENAIRSINRGIK